MQQAFRTFGRVVGTHWPALMAWYLAGEVVHRVLLQLAGTVAGYTTLGGLLILPLAVAARLVSYVAMYLSVRPSLPHTTSDRLGWRGFGHAVVVAILPFFAFYEAWGMLTVDRDEFLRLANEIAFVESGYGTDALGDRGGTISAGPLPITVLVVAFALRLLLARFDARLGTALRVVAVYSEVLWTFLLVTLVSQWWGRTLEWLSQRAGADWLRNIGDWFTARLPPIAEVWESASWGLGIVIAAVIIPAAWLIVVGVIYGTSFETETRLGRWSAVSLHGPARAIARSLVVRLEGLWAAAAVIWRGGLALFGATTLAYALWALLDRLGSRAVLELIGGHDEAFWEAFHPIVLVAIAAVAEPLRVALLATCYDVVIARPSAGLHTGSGLDGESIHLTALTGDVEEERPPGIGRNNEHGDDVVRG